MHFRAKVLFVLRSIRSIRGGGAPRSVPSLSLESATDHLIATWPAGFELSQLLNLSPTSSLLGLRHQTSRLLAKFLLIARYVPNVAKKSIWDQCNIEDRPPTDRPTSVPGRAFLEEVQTAISPYQCQMDAWSIWTTHRKSTPGSRMVTWPMTSRDHKKSRSWPHYLRGAIFS